jgi:hypothetical protein
MKSGPLLDASSESESRYVECLGPKRLLFLPVTSLFTTAPRMAPQSLCLTADRPAPEANHSLPSLVEATYASRPSDGNLQIDPIKPGDYYIYHMLYHTKLYTVPIQCICVSRMVLPINSDSFSKQH